MTTIAHARTTSPFEIANGILRILGHPVGPLPERTGATHRKESRGHTFLIDGGHRQWAAFRNFGQVIRKPSGGLSGRRLRTTPPAFLGHPTPREP
ncbi:hypothetical protein AB0K15_43030 [Amycolatopsis sp. NPDC049253]|uniref:hypothetical protein n=1 Tax=Amycolatopsis sp. NPDC049253 TaxID=3155274 RepID=UPI003427E87E